MSSSKLDQYCNSDPQLNLQEIQQDIGQMRDIANQAYDQMPNILMDLNPETQTDLVAAIRSRTDSMAERAFPCAYCMPEFTLSTIAMLKKNPSPSEEEIREYLLGDLF